MLNRRKVMGMLGVGVAAGPAVARGAVGALENQQLVRTVGYANAPNTVTGGILGDQIIDSAEHARKMASFFARGVFPEFFERELREQAKQINGFDVDILAKKSWSDSVKIQEQRERNYQKLLESRRQQWASNNEHNEFYKQNGFWI